MKSLTDLAQELRQHASTGPAPKGQPGIVANVLSPHLERFYVEAIRNYLIQATKKAQSEVASELASLRSVMPAGSQAQVDLSAGRIQEILSSIYK